MIALVSLIILVAVGFLIFASQNTSPVTIQLGFTILPDVPLNIALMSAVIVGIMLTWLVTFLVSVITFLVEDTRRKDRDEWNKVLTQITRRLHKAEIAIDQLKQKEDSDDEQSL